VPYPKQVITENEFLATAFGQKQGRGWFQWLLGEDLTHVIPVRDDLGEPVVDFHCACGVNQAVHTNTNCNWSSVVPRMEKVCLVPRLARNWVMSVWAPLPTWGYYCPVGDPEKPLYMRDDMLPTHDDTLLVMAAVTEHYSKKAVERTRETLARLDEAERVSLDPDQMGSRQRQMYQRLKDEAPVGLKDEYGKTTQFHAQTGVGPSPRERKIIVP
jgi:hypothetical protein